MQAVAGPAPSPTTSKFMGPFTNRSKTDFGRSFVDGATNTFLFGEAMGGTEGTTRSGYSWIGCGFMIANNGLEGLNARRLGPRPHRADEPQPVQQPAPEHGVFLYGRRRREGLPITINYDIFQGLGGLADGVLASPTELTP